MKSLERNFSKRRKGRGDFSDVSITDPRFLRMGYFVGKPIGIIAYASSAEMLWGNFHNLDMIRVKE
ncbi:hypothetical protein KQH40_00210 [bacterium]|nr:hypothetical protein [bacterium]